MNQFQYQIPLASKVTTSLENQRKPVVLACSTSGGKSFIAIRVLEQYFRNKIGRKAVFLGSNMTVLANQFHSILQNNCPVPFSFTYSMISDGQDTDLKIGLPQSLINMPQKISMLILDESQWLWPQVETSPNSMLSKVLKLCQPEAVLLLTGSPSYFTRKKDQYVIHYLSYQDIPNSPARVFSKVDMDLVSVANRNDIEECLQAFWKSGRQKRYDLSQIAVVARNVTEAEKVKQILEQKYRLRCVISTSSHDADSANLLEFKTGKFDCCISINRLIAGYSYNNLTCILDLASSQNINRSFQLFSRLLRVKDDSSVKSYHRICLRQHGHREVYFLYKMRSLLSRHTYTNYTHSMSKDDGLLEAA